MAVASIKKLPSKETLWLTTLNESGVEYKITSNFDRSTYFLYKKTESGYEKLSKAKCPTDFDNIIYPEKKEVKSKSKTKK